MADMKTKRYTEFSEVQSFIETAIGFQIDTEVLHSRHFENSEDMIVKILSYTHAKCSNRVIRRLNETDEIVAKEQRLQKAANLFLSYVKTMQVLSSGRNPFTNEDVVCQIEFAIDILKKTAEFNDD